MSWIEIVDASGRVVARRTALAVPCTIGSALDNTLVVDGPDMSPYHARIDREGDGSLTVTVLGQSSGLHRPGAPERAMTLVLTPSASVAVGGSVIRVVGDATGGAPGTGVTLEQATPGWRAIVARRAVQWGAVALLALGGAAIGFFTTPGSDRALNMLVIAAGVLVAECLWVGVWAIVGRLRYGQARFGQHFVVATAIAILGWVVGEMESWQKFLVPGAKAVAIALIALTAAVWALAILAHLRVMNQANWPKHVRLALGFGLAVIVLMLTAREYRGEWNNDVNFASVLKPVPAAVVPAKSPEQFTTSLKKLQGELDRDDVEPVLKEPVEASPP